MINNEGVSVNSKSVTSDANVCYETFLVHKKMITLRKDTLNIKEGVEMLALTV